MKILVDTREQKPFLFADYWRYADVTTKSATLTTGDYTLEGFDKKVAVERKELGDLLHCLGQDRKRFTDELERSLELDAFMVVIEANHKDIATENYRSRFRPHDAFQSITAFMIRSAGPFWFAG